MATRGGDVDGVESLYRGQSGRVLFAVALGTLAINLGRQAIPPLLPAIIEDLAISTAAAGLALTVMRVAFASSQYPGGRVADAVSRTAAILGGIAITVAGFALLSRVGSYPVLILCTVLLGVGSAFFFVAGRVLLSDRFVVRRGTAFGVTSAVSRLGSIAAAGLAVLALRVGRWQLAFVPVALLLVAIAGGFHHLRPDPYGTVRNLRLSAFPATARATAARVFGRRQVRWLVVAYTLVVLTWEGTAGFLPTYLHRTKGFSLAVAGGGFATLFAVGVVVQPLAGRASDARSRRRVAGIATLVSAAGLAGIVVGSSAPVVGAGIIVYAAGFMAFSPVVQAHLMDVFPEANKGGDLGAFKTVYEGLSSVGPTYVGVVAGVASFTVAFGGFVACLVVGTAILLGLDRAGHQG